MSRQERGIKFNDAIIITTGNRFYMAEATVRPDDSIGLSIFLADRCSYKRGDKMTIFDILVNPSSGHDLSSG